MGSNRFYHNSSGLSGCARRCHLIKEQGPPQRPRKLLLRLGRRAGLILTCGMLAPESDSWWTPPVNLCAESHRPDTRTPRAPGNGANQAGSFSYSAHVSNRFACVLISVSCHYRAAKTRSMPSFCVPRHVSCDARAAKTHSDREMQPRDSLATLNGLNVAMWFVGYMLTRFSSHSSSICSSLTGFKSHASRPMLIWV